MRTDTTPTTATSAEELLRELAEYATDRDYAVDGYADAVLERESEYPTGLSIPDESFGIAIPHADPEYVREDAVVLGLPDDPVRFRSMDDPEKPVDAEAVLLLCSTGSEGYTTFLSNLASLFQDDRFVASVREGDTDAVLDLVDEHCL